MDAKSESDANEKPKRKIDISEMLTRLDGMYDKEEEIVKEIDKLQLEFLQLQQDKELLQTMIMHQSNKADLYNTYQKTMGKK